MKKKFTLTHDSETVANIIMNTVNPQAEWHQIVAAVREHFEVKDWVQIRKVLQYLLNNNMIKRDPDIMIENFLKVTE
jgi:hypothetical protein